MTERLNKDRNKISIRIGVAFIMAASATGPGFMTQASKFTENYGTSLIIAFIVSIFLVIEETLVRIIYPEDVKALIFLMLILLGGSVGGYITFVGGHRLIDAGVTGEENIHEIDKSILTGIGIASIVRILFFSSSSWSS